jgi:tetratricopeptide (TPR) repeat protein
MTLRLCLSGLFILFLGNNLVAQHSVFDEHLVSLYELQHKPPANARVLVSKANSMLKHGQYAETVKTMLQALAADPDYWEAANDLGCAYLKLGQQRSAQEAFQRAIDIDPENAIAYTNMGMSALVEGDYKLAKQSALSALRIEPDLLEAMAVQGLSEVGEGHWTAEARKLLEPARDFLPAADRVCRDWPDVPSQGPKLVVVANRYLTVGGPHPADSSESSDKNK